MGRRDSDDWRGWKDGKYDNRYSRNYRRNRNKTKPVTVGIVFLLIIGVFGFILLEQGYLDESIQNTPQEVQDISKTAKNFAIETTAKLSETINEISDAVPIELEPKSELEDCSKYKKEVRDIDDVYFGVLKTKECEQRNKQIEMKQGTVTSQSKLTKNYPTVTLSMDNRGSTADFQINTVRVVNSDYYKIININMLMTVHMKLQDQIYFSPTALWNLKSPSGEIYAEQCHGPQFDMMLITGKQNPNITWDICYHVEKELNTFDLLKSTSKIGTIILD